MKATMANVQNHATLENNHPYNNNKVSANGTRLLRRLSNIFHFDKADSGFDTNPFSLFGIKGRNQLAICQSPRIQRCRRCISDCVRCMDILHTTVHHLPILNANSILPGDHGSRMRLSGKRSVEYFSKASIS
jgi:hypothetical protein